MLFCYFYFFFSLDVGRLEEIILEVFGGKLGVANALIDIKMQGEHQRWSPAEASWLIRQRHPSIHGYHPVTVSQSLLIDPHIRLT